MRGTPYLLRLIIAGATDPTRWFACMNTAVEAGIAPRIRYANAEDRVLITDFVEPKPFPDDVVPFIAPTLHTLHSLPNFLPPMMGNYLQTMDGFVSRFQAAKLLPESETDKLFRSYAAVTKAYPRNGIDLVASHKDLKPQNMVFDGERIWLIDWEAAFLNDKYVDLAVVANFLVKDEAHEEEYRSAYFGEPAEEDRRARFYLMRQSLHLFYAAFLILMAAKAGTTIDADLTAPDFKEFHRRLISREEDITTADASVVCAKVHLNELRGNLRAPRFEETLARVASNLALGVGQL